MIQTTSHLLRHLRPASFSNHLTLGLLAAWLIVGCGKKPESPAPEPPRTSGSVDSLLKDPGAQPDSPAAPVVSENAAAVPDQKPDELPDYNTIANAVNSYLVKYQRPPKDFEELVAKGFLKKPPPPPPGKKYVLNQRFSTLTVVDK